MPRYTSLCYPKAPVDVIDRAPRQAAPPPPPPPQEEEEEEIEEEVISLQPIGPGLQNLEPDDPGTLKRAITPSFPVQGETTHTLTCVLCHRACLTKLVIALCLRLDLSRDLVW